MRNSYKPFIGVLLISSILGKFASRSLRFFRIVASWAKASVGASRASANQADNLKRANIMGVLSKAKGSIQCHLNVGPRLNPSLAFGPWLVAPSSF